MEYLASSNLLKTYNLAGPHPTALTKHKTNSDNSPAALQAVNTFQSNSNKETFFNAKTPQNLTVVGFFIFQILFILFYFLYLH